MKRNILFAFLICAALASCKKETLTTYNAPGGKDNIYLGYANTDSVVYSFAYNPTLNQDTVWVPVKISGNRVNHSRNFVLSVDVANSSAVRILHYQPLKPSYTMPADSGTVHVPVIILNTDTGLSNYSVKLAIQVSGGTDFSSNLPLDIRSKQIVFSNRLEEPAWWPYWGQLGGYSRVKHQLFLISSGTTDLVQLNPQVDPNYFLYIPRDLYYINNMHEFLIDPFNWIKQNPSKGFVLTPRNDNTGDYDFYNQAAPNKKFWLKYFPTVKQLIFMDENKNQILI